MSLVGRINRHYAVAARVFQRHFLHGDDGALNGFELLGHLPQH